MFVEGRAQHNKIQSVAALSSAAKFLPACADQRLKKDLFPSRAQRV
jgi:hypothetical protein